jgi:hypothetical protein
MDWILDLMTTYTHHSELLVITELSLMYTLYKSLHAKSSTGVSWERMLTVEIHQLPVLRPFLPACLPVITELS